MIEIKIYQVPVDDQDKKPELVAESVEELLMLINEERIDTENNYLLMTDGTGIVE